MHRSQEALHAVPTRNHRFHLLDALRGVAALIVLLFHLPTNLSFGIAAPIAYIAVDFFFCLSGFVIAFSYEERLRNRVSLKDFAVARLIRLYPLYLLGAVFGLVSSLFIAHAAFSPYVSKADVSLVILFGLFLIPNFVAHWTLPFSFPLNVVSWSLFYEIAANLAFAVLARLRWAKSAALLSLALVSLALLAYHVTLGGGTTLDLGARPSTFYFGLARVGYSFFIGILICRLYLAAPRPAFAHKLPWLLPAAVTVATVAVLLASSHFAQSMMFQLLAIGLIFPAIVYFGAWSTLPQRFNQVCGFFGDFSYPLYILHYPLILALNGRKFQHFALAHLALAQTLIAAWCVFLVTFAWCAGRYYDAPVRRWLTGRYNAHVRRTAPVDTQQLTTVA